MLQFAGKQVFGFLFFVFLISILAPGASLELIFVERICLLSTLCLKDIVALKYVEILIFTTLALH